MLFCCILTGVMDIGVILFSILLSRFCACDIVGYAFVVFQYGSFLVLAWLAGNVVFALWGYIAGKSQAVPKEQELHVLVLITATILTVGEIFLSSRKWLPVPLLPFACLAGAGVAAGEICFWRFCKGVFYDTDS